MTRSAVITALLLALGACGDDASSDERGRDAAALAPGPVLDAGDYEFPCLEGGATTGDPTFTAIYREIFCTKGCAGVYCHGSRIQSGGLSIETLDIAYAELLDESAGEQPIADDEGCKSSGLRRVVPGEPEQSLLYKKVSERFPCGLPMPPPTGAWTPLSAAQQAQIYDWIASGAHDDRVAPTDDGGR